MNLSVEIKSPEQTDSEQDSKREEKMQKIEEEGVDEFAEERFDRIQKDSIEVSTDIENDSLNSESPVSSVKKSPKSSNSSIDSDTGLRINRESVVRSLKTQATFYSDDDESVDDVIKIPASDNIPDENQRTSIVPDSLETSIDED